MLTDNDNCFACGSKNAGGMQLSFSCSDDGQTVETTFVPGEQFQGWAGIVHGGIIVTLLDEIMAKAAVHRGLTVLTGEISARFRAQAKVGEPLRCTGKIDTVKKNIIYASARILSGSGSLVAEGSAKMVNAAGG
jgi:uncharacterized protein (TIGR00369 family)